MAATTKRPKSTKTAKLLKNPTISEMCSENLHTKLSTKLMTNILDTPHGEISEKHAQRHLDVFKMTQNDLDIKVKN